MSLQAQTTLQSKPVRASGSSGFAISEWHDTDEVMRRMDVLLSQPTRTSRRENMDKVLRYFDEKCQASKRIAEKAAAVIPGGIQHKLAERICAHMPAIDMFRMLGSGTEDVMTLV